MIGDLKGLKTVILQLIIHSYINKAGLNIGRFLTKQHDLANTQLWQITPSENTKSENKKQY